MLVYNPRIVTLVVFAAGARAVTAVEWPSSLQPFFLSALSSGLTAEQAEYIGRFPLVAINHKQGSADPGTAEAKQLAAIEAIRRANASCRTFFYLNSQVPPPGFHLGTFPYLL